jgi:hypothetical protein
MPRRERKFSYGPLFTGVFLALVSVIPVVMLAFPEYIFHYLSLLLLLAIGLRAVIERTGLYEVYQHVRSAIAERLDRKFVARRRAEIEREIQAEKRKKSRYQDPKLPKNW